MRHIQNICSNYKFLSIFIQTYEIQSITYKTTTYLVGLIIDIWVDKIIVNNSFYLSFFDELLITFLLILLQPKN